MLIKAVINYWGEGIATFDPDKVLIQLETWFPEVEIDPIDHSQKEEDWTIQFANNNLSEPQRSTLRGGKPVVIATKKSDLEGILKNPRKGMESHERYIELKDFPKVPGGVFRKY